MSIENVRKYLAQFGRDSEIIEFEKESATVSQAAEDLGTEEGRIAKTMSFMLSSGPIVIVLAGDARISNRKYKDTFGEKARMVQPADVESVIGHPVGGVCPFACKAGVKAYLDQSLRKYDYVYPAAGSRNSAIKLTPDEILTLSNAEGWIDIS